MIKYYRYKFTLTGELETTCNKRMSKEFIKQFLPFYVLKQDISIELVKSK